MAANKLHRQKAHRRWLSAYGIPPEQVVGIPSMAVAIAPLLLISGYILAQPGIGPLGMSDRACCS
jgi:hypothetical protein